MMNFIKNFWPRYRRALYWLALIVLIAVSCLFYPRLKFLLEPKTIEIKNTDISQNQAFSKSNQSNFWLPDTKKQIINFLLLGAPGQGNDAPDLTDTILIARLDENKNKIYLFSLPRDLLVKIPNSDTYTKINALYAFNKKNFNHEFDALWQKTEEITGLKINHYIFVDLETVKNLVDFFGGVNVMVKKDILDAAFPGPNHSFEVFEIKSGWRYLDGAAALKYIRSRHNSAGGDFDRIERQQEVLQALKQKVLALRFWDVSKFMNVYKILSSRIKTDLNLWEINNFWQKIKNIPGENIIKIEINNENLLIGGQMNLGGEIASVLKPKTGLENYEEIKKYITEIITK
jgi:LCP family protein required for cell wall assembly